MGKRRVLQKTETETIDSLLVKTVDDEIDLHGLDARAAEIRLESFLGRTRPGAVVRVITGRGNRSEGEAVLRPLVDRLLGGRLAKQVAQYRIDPGGGAYLVQVR